MLLAKDQEVNPKLLLIYRLLLSAYMPRAGFPSNISFFGIFFFFLWLMMCQKWEAKWKTLERGKRGIFFFTQQLKKKKGKMKWFLYLEMSWKALVEINIYNNNTQFLTVSNCLHIQHHRDMTEMKTLGENVGWHHGRPLTFLEINFHPTLDRGWCPNHDVDQYRNYQLLTDFGKIQPCTGFTAYLCLIPAVIELGRRTSCDFSTAADCICLTAAEGHLLNSQFHFSSVSLAWQLCADGAGWSLQDQLVQS